MDMRMRRSCWRGVRGAVLTHLLHPFYLAGLAACSAASMVCRCRLSEGMASHRRACESRFERVNSCPRLTGKGHIINNCCVHVRYKGEHWHAASGLLV